MQQKTAKTRGRHHYLPEWQAAYGFTNTEIAAFTEADKSRVSRWFGKPRSEPGDDYLIKLGKMFGVEPKQFYGPPPPNREFTRTTDDPALHDGAESDGLTEYGHGVALIDGELIFRGKIPGSAPETSDRGGLGPGQLEGIVASVETKGIATGHVVVAEWVIPPTFLRHGLGGKPDTTLIVPVVGHSMEPRLYEGDRVIVDVSQNRWVADAIYVITFDDDNLQVKTLKIDRSVKPRLYRIISEASPGDEERLGPDDFRIVGRVVGRISRP